MIIAISGPAGSGKDTVANFFIQDHGFEKVSFAANLYEEAAEAFGVDVVFLANRDTKETPLPELALINCNDKYFVNVIIELYFDPNEGTLEEFEELPRSPRFILQHWGTQYRREKFGDTYWIDRAGEKIKAVKNAVITDLRFDNEDDFLRNIRDSSVIRIHVTAEGRIDKVIEHVSEKGLPLVVGDYVVDNSKDRQHLDRQVRGIIRSIGFDLV